MKNPVPKKVHDKFMPFTYTREPSVRLPRSLTTKSTSFADVLENRRSCLPIVEPPSDVICELLFRSMKIESMSLDQRMFITSRRTAPSAGGRHPVDVLVSFPTESMRDRKLAYYNPIEHSLANINVPNDVLMRFFHEVDRNVPIGRGCLLWFSIQARKTSSKYDNPESLYWRDTGALLYCMQLVATWLDLATMPVGSLAAKSYRKIFPKTTLISGGGLLVGC